MGDRFAALIDSQRRGPQRCLHRPDVRKYAAPPTDGVPGPQSGPWGAKPEGDSGFVQRATSAGDACEVASAVVASGAAVGPAAAEDRGSIRKPLAI